MSLPRKLGLQLRGMTARGARVTLNDQDISHMLTGLTLTIGVDEVNTCTLQVLLDEIDCDAETLAVLEAHVRVQGDRDAIEASGQEAVEVTQLGDDRPRFMAGKPHTADATTVADSHRRVVNVGALDTSEAIAQERRARAAGETLPGPDPASAS